LPRFGVFEDKPIIPKCMFAKDKFIEDAADGPHVYFVGVARFCVE
jgi:hypothetical protein